MTDLNRFRAAYDALFEHQRHRGRGMPRLCGYLADLHRQAGMPSSPQGRPHEHRYVDGRCVNLPCAERREIAERQRQAFAAATSPLEAREHLAWLDGEPEHDPEHENLHNLEIGTIEDLERIVARLDAKKPAPFRLDTPGAGLDQGRLAPSDEARELNEKKETA